MKNPKYIYAFAFRNNIGEKVLDGLDIEKRFKVGGVEEIKKMADSFVEEQPEYILGMGVWSGRDQDKIRIEQKCSNKFRNDFVDEAKLENYKFKPFLRPI